MEIETVIRFCRRTPKVSYVRVVATFGAVEPVTK